MDVCVDRVFRVASHQTTSYWDGKSSAFGSFADVFKHLIDNGKITQPGPYCIIRLDRTVHPNKLQELVYVCTIMDDMSIKEGLVAPSRVTRWPPKP